MKKSQAFKSFTLANQISPAENLEAIFSYIDNAEPITFFSWKMFKLGNPNFDSKEALKFIGREKMFVNLLQKLDIKYKYVKLIPDELPKYFFAKKSPEAKEFARQVECFFSENLVPTKSILMSSLLKKTRMQDMYDFIYDKVAKDFSSLVNTEKLKKEVQFRGDEYIAKKAFGLFASEAAIIYSNFKNPVLLAGIRSIDTYKYEFFKFPKNRPVLPKIFVI